jgi:hypothetical protein
LAFGVKRLFQSSAKIRGTAACLMKEPGCFATSRLFFAQNFRQKKSPLKGKRANWKQRNEKVGKKLTYIMRHP